jgi:hypothetical protein
MKRMVFSCLIIVMILALMSCGALAPYAEAPKVDCATNVYQNMAKGLMTHYPSIKYVSGNTVFFVDGNTLPYDDNKVKTFNEKLENADIKDHFTQCYPAFTPIIAPAYNSDPGRFRNDALLKQLYGKSRGEIEANLVEVDWLPINGGKKLLFNKKEKAAAQLQKVSRELDRLPIEYMKYIINIDGTYEYRPIEGTNRLSPHSYGIAIDLETRYTSYWLWDKEYAYVNEIPRKIVEIFEKYGFVWGGRWYHYDTMHFEYRPEMFERVL